MLEIERVTAQGTDIFWMFMIGFVMIALLRYMYPVILRRDTISIFYFSGADMDPVHREKSDAMYGIMSVMIFSYIVSLVFTVWYDMNFKETVFVLKDMFYVLMWVLAYVVGRSAIDVFIGWLFSISSYTKLFVEKSTAFRVSVGIYGILAFFILWYVNGGMSMVIDYKMLVIAICVYVFAYFLVMVEYLLQSVSYFLYFIFYLCVVEICPLLLVWSILENKLIT
ncbi:MAG: DUF4271 domain-containing protein [Flavobacteriales bacterium]|nr:DUF4271 domain-containing protein [Flavobacteriales bacterium]